MHFIQSPITAILTNAVAASSGIGNGIETYSLYDYLMQSVFLKMTGAQEQKMKCICWEIASADYDYRYERFSKRTLGECSSYDEKKIVYKDLLDQIRKTNPGFNALTDIPKEELLNETIADVQEVFTKTNFSIWGQKNLDEFLNTNKLIEVEDFIARVDKKSDDTKLFENKLKNMYEALYKHRNRCAHNTESYQRNLPTLNALIKKEYRYENYFVWFAILILIDKIFIALFNKYLEDA